VKSTEPFRNLIDGIDRVLDRASSVIFIAICIIVFIQVIARFVLRFPTPWSEELARYLLVLLVFLGSGVSLRGKSHLIALNLFEGRSESVAKAGRLLVDGIVLFVCIFFTRNSVRMSSIAGTEMASSMIWLKTSYLYLVIAAGFFFSSVFTAFSILETLVGTRGGERK